MRKRTAAFTCISAGCLVIGGMVLYSWLNPAVVATEADYHLYGFEEMEERADLIVKGTKSGVERQFIDYDHGGGPLSWYTVSDIDLVDVYKGNAEESFAIVEPFATDTNLAGRTIYSLGGYVPIEEGEQYILFLRLIADVETADAFSIDLTSEKLYEIVGHYQGQHLLSDIQYTEGELPYEDDHYVLLHEKVLEKYK
ncbi:hypothetical protein JOC54_000026 [Alkalihalobacillus xiaoxiensis]|uniref:Uncharacterized protein n=1 Tax=Shouchella xiaoxiensis TaxID=766895 RepID=A0ABS2SNJ1_9BACI|nr:hypothetical protein [Shouchella xiaoxiensis]MBM7836795.1 hypothetical protein [Shouchella xiaoxiensis]